MKNKKKKIGFTLIELLAVIIVLAIIALIATPIIFNVIENAKIKSLENSCYGVIDAVRTKYAENLLNSENGLVDLEGEVEDLTIAGEHPYMGTWEIDNSKDSAERGIKIQGVKFQSMKNYTCSNVDENGAITNKVSCEKDGPDEVQPTITANQTTVEVNKGTDKKIKSYFTVKFGKTGGRVICEVANVSELDAGDHTVKCTATGTNGKTAEATVTIKVSNIFVLKDEILGASDSNIVTSGNGLYSETTNNGTTYYFKGAVTNNYVKFANQIWRIIRVNEDGTIRLITHNNAISQKAFNSIRTSSEYIYYTNSEIKSTVNDWYTAKISSLGLDEKVANGDYFCEQAKVVMDTDFSVRNVEVVTKDNYAPSFDCTTDGNGKGIVSGKVGLITVDEVLYAGGKLGGSSNFYLKSSQYYWTMSPAGYRYNTSSAHAWFVDAYGTTTSLYYYVDSNSKHGIRPVINLNYDTLASGSGTSSDPYVVK